MAEYIDVLEHLRADNLLPVELDILVPDANLANVALFQCHGEISANPNSISAAASHQFTDKADSFINHISERQPSLALAPEYSVPWASLGRALDEEMLPRPGAIWVLGCESCTPDELREFASNFPKVHWIHEGDDITAGPGQFLDPVVMLFRVTTNSAESLCICVQFKTTQMGGDPEHQIEGVNLIRGRKRYIIRGGPDSICLLALICSDVFDFETNEIIGFQNFPFLICHLQMTKNPFYDRFAKYRTDIFDRPMGFEWEFLTLNWAAGHVINGTVQSDDCGGSAYYLKPKNLKHDPNSTDLTINENHSQGIYLKYCNRKRYAGFYFHTDECVIYFYTRKVSQRLADDVAQISRYGAKTPYTYLWDQTHRTWTACPSLPDGIEKIAQTIYAPLQSLFSARPLDRERLFTISLGEVDDIKGACWYSPRFLPGLQVTPDEYPKGRMVKLRESQTNELEDNFIHLRTLIRDVLPDIARISDHHRSLGSTHIELGFTDDQYKSNTVTTSGSANAIISYVGEVPAHRANRILDLLEKQTAQRRVIVVYQDGNAKKCAESEPPKINQTNPQIADITDPNK
jgi:hypothetical protein